MKSNVFITFLILSILSACSGSTGTDNSQTTHNLTSGGEIVSVPVTTSSDRDSYDQENAFCDYVLFHKTEQKILIDYNFFPLGTDVCQQVTYDPELNPSGACRAAKTVVLPCDFDVVAGSDGLLSASISAPLDGSACANQIILDVSAAEFTLGGLVFPFTDSLDVFSQSLGFKITRAGIVSSSTSEILVFDSKDFGLEEIVSELQ